MVLLLSGVRMLCVLMCDLRILCVLLCDVRMLCVLMCDFRMLRVVGCLVNEVRSLKDDFQRTKLNGNVNFYRDAIFSEVGEVNEREKKKALNYIKGF